MLLLGGGMMDVRPVLLFIVWIGTEYIYWSVVQLARCGRLRAVKSLTLCLNEHLLTALSSML